METFFGNIISSVNFKDIIDILVVCFLVYKILGFIKESRAEQLIKGIVILVFFTLISDALGLYTLNWILKGAMAVGVIAIVIVLQPELRRALEYMGRSKLVKGSFLHIKDDERLDIVNRLSNCIDFLSSTKTGALIIIENEISLTDIAETGVKIDAEITEELLKNLFFEGSPLHDGAVIIRGNRILAAGCVLPLSENTGIAKALGTRHRAGIGITEVSDAIAIIVSEETGVVSISIEGKLSRFLDVSGSKRKIAKIYEKAPQDSKKENLFATIKLRFKQLVHDRKEKKLDGTNNQKGNKNFLKILAAVISIVIWFYVTGEVNPVIKEDFKGIPITIINEENLNQRNFAISGNRNFAIDVELKGKRSLLTELQKKDIKATIDVLGYESGENSVPIKLDLPKGVKLVDSSANNCLIKVEQLVSVYKDIDVKFVGDFPKGKEPTVLSVGPDKVEVKGAKSLVDQVADVEAKVSSKDVSETKKLRMVSVKCLDSKGEEVKDVKISNDIVTLEFIMLPIKKVPLNLKVTGNPHLEYKINIPKEVYIKGEESKLNDIEKVDCEDIDISKIKVSTKLALDMKLPEGIYLGYDSEDIGVDLEIGGINYKEIIIKGEDIDFLNLGKNLKSFVKTDEVILEIADNDEDVISNIRNHVKLTVDLLNLKEGEYTLPIKLKSNTEFKNIKVIPAKVQVTINSNE